MDVPIVIVTALGTAHIMRSALASPTTVLAVRCIRTPLLFSGFFSTRIFTWSES